MENATINMPPRNLWQRHKTPTLLQMEAVECGAAALGIILGHHGKYVPLEQLRTECGVSRDGSKASNVRKVAEKHGLIAKAYRKELKSFWESVFPVIVFWNFNHFLVVEGFKKNKIFLNDPGSGPRTVTLDEFNSSFTGIVMTFEPGPDFELNNEKPNILSGLVRRLRASSRTLLFVFLAALAMVLPGIVVPSFSRVWIDNVLLRNMTHWIGPVILAMCIALIVQATLLWIQSYVLLRLETKLAMVGASSFFHHLLKLPIVFYQQRSPGEISTRLALSDQIATLLSGNLARAVLGLITMVFYCAIMFHYSVLLTMVSIFFAAYSLITLRLLNRKRVDLGKAAQADIGKWQGITMRGLQMIESFKASGGESEFFSMWSGYHAKAVNKIQAMMLLIQAFMIAPVISNILSSAAILGIGGYMVMEGKLTIGMLFAFQLLSAGFMQPVTQLLNLGDQIQQAESGIARIDDVIQHPEDPELDASGSEKIDVTSGVIKLAGAVAFNNVTFGYSRLDPPLLNKFNLSVKPGERVALVGHTGCGKSTLIRILMGLYQPWDGKIMLDGNPYHDCSREIRVGSMAMVDQNIFLFEGSIRDNISLWDQTVPEDQIIRAAKDACIHDDITHRHGGYSSNIEEEGRNFSGGQRQRLEIARALVNNPSILVLDEATSALDPGTEKMIDDNLRRRGCTCIIVAHRLSTIRDCDQIIVIKNGAIVESGIHDELVAKPSVYSELIEN